MSIFQDLVPPHRCWHMCPGDPTFACLAIKLERESHGAAAVHSGGRVLAGAVAAAVVHRARFCTRQSLGPLREIITAPTNIMGTRHSPKHPATHICSLEPTSNCSIYVLAKSLPQRFPGFLQKLHKPKYCLWVFHLCPKHKSQFLEDGSVTVSHFPYAHTESWLIL